MVGVDNPKLSKNSCGELVKAEECSLFHIVCGSGSLSKLSKGTSSNGVGEEVDKDSKLSLLDRELELSVELNSNNAPSKMDCPAELVAIDSVVMFSDLETVAWLD